MIKLGKSQRLHLIVDFFPSFNKILSAGPSLAFPCVSSMVRQGRLQPSEAGAKAGACLYGELEAEAALHRAELLGGPASHKGGRGCCLV